MADEEKTEAPAEEAQEAAPAEAAPAEEKAEAPAEEKAEDTGPKLTAREIEKMNVPKLKEAALAYGGRISGVHGMDKPQLIRALKEINDIPLQEPRRASKIDRTAVKQKAKNLRKERDQYLEEHNGEALRRVRRRRKALRRKLVRTA